MIKRSLITGAAGLVGSQTLVELLLRGDGSSEIHCTLHSEGSKERLASKLEANGLSIDRVICHSVDLEDFAAVSSLIDAIEPSIIYHTAAEVSLTKRDGEQMVRRNVDMTHFLVEALLDLKNRAPERIDPLFVHVSSVAALGSAEMGAEIDHTTPFVDITNVSPYARSKFLSQNDVLRASKLGLNVVIINPSVIIGSGNAQGKMHTLFAMIRRGIPFYTSGQMGYVDVCDVARAMVMLAREPKSWGQCYVLNGATLTFREFITIFGSPFAKGEPKIGLSDWVVRTIEWAVRSWSRIRGSEALIPKGYLTTRYRYDGSRIEHTLPDFRYTPIQQTATDIARNL